MRHNKLDPILSAAPLVYSSHPSPMTPALVCELISSIPMSSMVVRGWGPVGDSGEISRR